MIRPTSHAVRSLCLLLLACAFLPPPAAEAAEDEPPWKRMRRTRDENADRRRADGGEYRFSFQGGGLYDRVRGITLSQRVEGSGGGDYAPEVTLDTGYSFGNDAWQNESTLLQPLAPNRLLLGGVSWYRTTRARAFDDGIVSDSENTFAALLFKEDYRDYYRAHGYALLLESRPGAGNSVRFGYRREDLKTLRVTSDWSLFHGDREFRPNDPVNTGESRSLEARYVLDTRGEGRRRPRLGLRWELQGERAGKGGLGGDFRYDRWLADLRQYTKLSPAISFDARVATGRIESESGGVPFPEHREFYAGGIGTLPGYAHKRWRGDRLFLASAEYRIGRGSKLLLAANAGDAWMASGRDMNLHTDVAVGFETDDSGLRVMFAEPVGEDGSDPVFWVRLQRTF